MKIPADAAIATDKLERYLLQPRMRNDKSAHLRQAGFTLDNPEALESAIRDLVGDHEAVSDREDEYGQFFTVTGDLQGPDGVLSVVTVWLRPHAGEGYRFVTLKPNR